MENTRLLKCLMFGEMVRDSDCVRGQEIEWICFFLDDLRAFGTNTYQWTAAAQDKEESRQTAEQGPDSGLK